MSSQTNIFTLLVIVLSIFSTFTYANRSFSIDYTNNEFRKDGKVFRYVSGSMHYFRVPTELWRDRLRKMKFGGLNAVQTYIEWSAIETSPGVYNFEGNNNFTRFITEAQEEGLLVILRPGPYICAERDMGGLPSWLLKEASDISLRSDDPRYIKAVDRWLKVLLPMLRPLLYHNGGPVIMVQLENEFGSYSTCAKSGDYKAYLRTTFRKLLGDEVVLFTTDGNGDGYIKCGHIPEVFITSDFGTGTNLTKALAILRRHQAHGPFVNSEFYDGWLDYWEYPHQTVQTQQFVKDLENLLAINASVNIYMYHGGTNFGFGAGSNNFGVFNPVPTSYDYDAAISEAGDLTPKFYAIKKVLEKHLPNTSKELKIVESNDKMQLPPVTMERKASIFELLPRSIFSTWPMSFEKLNHTHGFMLYSSNITFHPTDPTIVSVPGLHDRAQVFIDRQMVGTISLTEKTFNVSVLASKGSRIDILVENQGRASYGDTIKQQKGILSNVTVNNVLIKGWAQYRIFDDWSLVLRELSSSTTKFSGSKSTRTPAFYRGQFKLPNEPHYPLESFLHLTGWTKGLAFINGHNLGRYWPVVGPQLTLYAPSVYFKPFPQLNEIVLFELEHSPCVEHNDLGDEKPVQCTVQFVKTPVINGSTPLHKVAKKMFFRTN